MRLNRNAAALTAGVTAAAMSLVVAPAPAMAASASPAAIVVDCGDATNGVSPTTITGQVGDTFTIDNTAGAGTCTFTSYSGVVSASDLDGSDQLASGDVSTVTILAAGTFTVEANSGSPQPMTVVIGTASSVPEYTISFDANGGACGAAAQSITAASGEWYALPTDGTGPYECHRDYYVLTGWSHGSTVLKPGGEQEAPDLVVPSPSIPTTPRIPGTGARIRQAFAPAGPWARSSEAANASVASTTAAQLADSEILYAVWTPMGVEITYDANVAAADSCQDSTGTDLAVVDRSTEAEVHFAGTDDSLATSAPCAPPGPGGTTLPLAGWALTGDGPVAYAPGVDLTMTKFLHGTRQTLYAVWKVPGLAPTDFVGDDNVRFGYEVDRTTQRLVLTIEMVNRPNMWVGLGFDNFMFPADSLIVSFDDTGEYGDLQYFDGYNPGIPTLSFFPLPAPDDDPILTSPGASPYDNQENWQGEVTYQDEETRVVTLTRALVTEDIFDIQLQVDSQYNACGVYSLEGEFDVVEMTAPAHQWTGCGVMVLE